MNGRLAVMKGGAVVELTEEQLQRVAMPILAENLDAFEANSPDYLDPTALNARIIERCEQAGIPVNFAGEAVDAAQ